MTMFRAAGATVLALALALALPLGACSLGPVVSRQAMDFNASIETTANALLLRNILRARDHQPLHFTSIPQIRGSLGSGISLGGAAPIGSQPQNAALVLPQGFLTSQPSFDVAALDTQEFARAILQPVDPEVVQFMLDRGLPQQMVLYMLVARIHEPDGRTVTNDPRLRPAGPNNAASALECRGRGGARFREGCDAFQLWVERRTVGRRLFFNNYIRMTPVSGPLTAAQAGDGQFMAAMQNPGLVTRRFNGQLRVWRPSQQFVLCSEPLRGRQANTDSNMMGGPAQMELEVQLEAAVQSTRSATQTVEEGLPPNALCSRQEVFASDYGPEGPPGQPPVHRIPGVQIRSVQEIFGYLGELLRRPDQGADYRFLVPVRGEHEGPRADACVPGTSLACPSLFHLRRTRDANTWLSLEHGGETLHVGRYDEALDQSSRVMAVLDILLNLYKSASAIPTTRAVQTLR